ncbi:proline-rich receptor-like protein kinase PERK8 [Iris pallida]|uniref:Proline-rich receptor-like protein kinase PERK8 n=1 Tax=Iris pallida TaxID=29817 RepID=A0AAX6FRS1_IRIPA|nr:proline-rich receptor-like protein kinase PERK8 [Iris pallida]
MQKPQQQNYTNSNSITTPWKSTTLSPSPTTSPPWLHQPPGLRPSPRTTTPPFPISSSISSFILPTQPSPPLY